MTPKIKKIVKILGAVLISLAMTFLGGMWYLSQNPIFFDKNSPVMKYVPEGLLFETLSLKVDSMYHLPELELTNVRYTTPELSLKTPKLQATWRIWSLLQGDFKIAAVTLENADIQVTLSSEDSRKPFVEELKDTLSKMPLKYLGAQDSRITIVTKEKIWCIENAGLYILQFFDRTNFKVFGDLQGLGNPLPFSGDLSLNFRNSFLTGNFKVKDLVLSSLPISDKALKKDLDFYNSPLTGEFFFNYDGRREKLDFTGSWKFDFEVPLSLSGTWLGGEGESLKATLKSPGFPVALLSKVWLPDKDKARAWILENVKEGRLGDTQISLEFKKGADGKELKLEKIGGAAQLYEGVISHLKTLSFLKGVEASLEFSHLESKIHMKKASLEDLRLDGSQVNLSNFHHPSILANFNLNVTGPLKGISKLLNLEPFKKELPVKISAQEGLVTVHLEGQLPLKEKMLPGDLVLAGGATLKKGEFTLQKGTSALSFSSTNMELTFNQTARKIEGQGVVNDLKSTFSWEENMNPSAAYKTQTKLTGTGKAEGLLKLLPSALKSYIKTRGGEVIVSYVSTEGHKDTSTVVLDLDFAKSHLAVPALNWSKPHNVPGKMALDLTLHKGAISQLRKFSLQSQGLDIQGRGVFDTKGHLISLEANPFRFNKLSGTGKASMKEGIWNVQFQIPFLNAEPFLDGLWKESPETKTDKSSSFSLDLKIGVLQLKNGISLKNIQTQMDLRAGKVSRLNFSGESEGQSLHIKHTPVGDKLVFEVMLPKLDILLNGMDISNKVQTKKVILRAESPLNDPRAPLKGKLSIEEVRLKDGPVFAKLLSLISLEGLLQNLRGQGIIFKDNDAEFEYKDKKIAILRAKMMNDSLGLTTEGYVDLKAKTLDLHGVLVPANFLNQLVGGIPILGTLLTGGKDRGIFSVSYSVKGPLDKPKISSNPLGILAPNILKSFFSGITGTGHQVPSLSGKEQSQG